MTQDEKFNVINPTYYIKSKLLLQLILSLGILFIIVGLFSFFISSDLAKVWLLCGIVAIILHGLVYFICQIGLLIKYRHVIGKKFIKSYFLTVVLYGIFEGIF